VAWEALQESDVRSSVLRDVRVRVERSPIRNANTNGLPGIRYLMEHSADQLSQLTGEEAVELLGVVYVEDEEHALSLGVSDFFTTRPRVAPVGDDSVEPEAPEAAAPTDPAPAVSTDPAPAVDEVVAPEPPTPAERTEEVISSPPPTSASAVSPPGSSSRSWMTSVRNSPQTRVRTPHAGETAPGERNLFF
jgi:hypothetical protein